MLRLVMLLVAAYLTVWAGVAPDAGASTLAKLHGGNILQTINEAAKDGNLKGAGEEATLKMVEGITTVTLQLKSTQGISSNSGEDLSSQAAMSITLHKDTGAVRAILCAVQWKKNEASALHAFVSAGFVTRIMGKIARPNITEDALKKLYTTLLGDKPGGFLDGKDRAARIDGTLCVAQFVPGVGLFLSMAPEEKK